MKEKTKPARETPNDSAYVWPEHMFRCAKREKNKGATKSIHYSNSTNIFKNILVNMDTTHRTMFQTFI